MDVVKFTEVYSAVKSFIPEVSSIELRDFIMSQDDNRQAWLKTAPLNEILDWIVPALREREKAKIKEVKCLRCGVLLLTETDIKKKYSGLFLIKGPGTNNISQIERDRNAIGVTCAVCGKDFCSGCMLKYGKPHPTSGGIACLECGGHMTEFRG